MVCHAQRMHCCAQQWLERARAACTTGLGPYAAPIKKVEEDIKSIQKKVNEVCGIKESDTGLAPPSRWDLVSDKQMMQEEQPLQVARCTKIINPGTDEAKYVINVKQIAKFVVGLGDKVRAQPGSRAAILPCCKNDAAASRGAPSSSGAVGCC